MLEGVFAQNCRTNTKQIKYKKFSEFSLDFFIMLCLIAEESGLSYFRTHRFAHVSLYHLENTLKNSA